MTLQVTVIMIGVKDLARSKTFYGEGPRLHDRPGLSQLRVVQPR